jgi:hypothetical protein
MRIIRAAAADASRLGVLGGGGDQRHRCCDHQRGRGAGIGFYFRRGRGIKNPRCRYLTSKKGQFTSDLIAVAYPDRETAEKLRAELGRLIVERTLELEDAVVIDLTADATAAASREGEERACLVSGTGSVSRVWEGRRRGRSPEIHPEIVAARRARLRPRCA